MNDMLSRLELPRGSIWSFGLVRYIITYRKDTSTSCTWLDVKASVHFCTTIFWKITFFLFVCLVRISVKCLRPRLIGELPRGPIWGVALVRYIITFRKDTSTSVTWLEVKASVQFFTTIFWKNKSFYFYFWFEYRSNVWDRVWLACLKNHNKSNFQPFSFESISKFASDLPVGRNNASRRVGPLNEARAMAQTRPKSPVFDFYKNEKVVIWEKTGFFLGKSIITGV